MSCPETEEHLRSGLCIAHGQKKITTIFNVIVVVVGLAERSIEVKGSSSAWGSSIRVGRP